MKMNPIKYDWFDESGLSSVDPSFLRSDILLDFLENREEEDIDDFAGEFCEKVSSGLSIVEFRNFLQLHIHFTILRYAQSLGAARDVVREAWEKTEFTDTDDTSSAEEIEKMASYLAGYLRVGLRLRERMHENQRRKGLAYALDYIEANYMHEELSLNMVAAAVGLSPNYFSAMFSQEMKMTFVEYVSRLRIRYAKQMLEETQLKSSEISALVGFHDSHYFSYVFKRVQKCSPRDYRKQMREGKEEV